jgi:hypothetical protein
MARGFFSDFLMGLEGGTRGLPQAIQNRERFGLRKKQYQDQEERLDWQRDSSNWQWRMKEAKERGDSAMVQTLWPEGIKLGIISAFEGEPHRPPPLPSIGDESASLLEDPGDVMAGFEEMTADPYPGVQDPRLRSRMMFMDKERKRKDLELERKEELFGLELEELTKEVSPETPWKQVGDNEFWWKTDEDGQIITQGDINSATDIKIYPKQGLMYNKRTGEFSPLPQDALDMMKEFGGNNVVSYDKDIGLLIMDDGSTKFVTDDIRKVISDHFDKVHRNRQALVDQRGDVQVMLAELRGRIRADASQLASEKRAYTDIISDITDNKVSLEGALERYYGALKAAKIPDARQTAQALTDHFALLALDRVPFSITNKQKEDLAESGYIWAQAEEIKDLLKKPIVKAHVGIIQGSLSDMKKRWQGERNANPDVVRFRFLLADMSDRIQRIRTGAVINESEKASYDDLMGSTLKDAIALGIRMETLQETMQGRKDTVWREGLDNSFGAKARDYIDKIPQYQSISGYRSEGRTVTDMTDEDFQ